MALAILDTSGVLLPQDLDAMQAVLDTVCAERMIGKGTSEQQGLALKLIALYEGGIQDPSQLTFILMRTAA